MLQQHSPPTCKSGPPQQLIRLVPLLVTTYFEGMYGKTNYDLKQHCNLLA